MDLHFGEQGLFYRCNFTFNRVLDLGIKITKKSILNFSIFRDFDKGLFDWILILCVALPYVWVGAFACASALLFVLPCCS